MPFRRLAPSAVLACLALPSGAFAQQPAAGPTPPDPATVDRAALLAPQLAEVRDHSGLFPFVAVPVAALGVAGVIATPLATDGDIETAGFEAACYVAAGLWAAGGAGSLLADEPWRWGLLGSALYLGTGTFFLGTAFENAGAEDAERVHPYLALFASGYLGSGALMLTSTLVRRPTVPSVLVRDYARLRTAELRRKLSREELAAIERHFRLAEPAIPIAWTLLPLAVTGAAMTVGAAADEGLGKDAKLGMALLGLAQALPALIALGQRSRVGLFESQLEGAGLQLELAAGPAGVGLRGSF